ncbi:MAG TPA: DUF6600 domain-containing protein [Terriglobales bacterium]|nr:DUF6600 domain-containing protein [Terriglobales bacterium]
MNYISGQVSIQPNGVDEWVAASVNRPLTSSDRVWTDRDSRTELQLGAASIRLNELTSITLMNVNNNNVQVQVDQGTLNLHITQLYDGEYYEVTTPNVAFTVRKKGTYRFDVDNAGDTTSVTVFRGEGDATGDGPSVRIKGDERYTFMGGRTMRYAVNHNPGRDGFDDWCFARADRDDRAVAARYVPRSMVGYSDLDYYGYWADVSPYGPVWYPRTVTYGWAPYRYGHWVWISPWGWTWVDDAPWGFAPFHYGRWVYHRNRWGWCPGPLHVRPVYAPALVAWYGGSSWGVGLSFGVGGGVGWFPLGWGEPYVPYYRHSRNYFQHVNVTNTRITNITNVTNNYYGKNHYNIHYKYREQPDAVTAVSNDVFRHSRPTRDGLVRVSKRDVDKFRPTNSVPVTPTTNSVLGTNAGEKRAVPPAGIDRRGRGRGPDRPEVGGIQTPGVNRGAQGPRRGDEPGRPVPVGPMANAPKNNTPEGQEIVVGRPNRGVPKPYETNIMTGTPDRPGRGPMKREPATESFTGPSGDGISSRVPRPGRVENNNPVTPGPVNAGPDRTPRGMDDNGNVNRGGRTIPDSLREPRTVPRPPENQPVAQPGNGNMQREERQSVVRDQMERKNDRIQPRDEGGVYRGPRGPMTTPEVRNETRSVPQPSNDRPVNVAPPSSNPGNVSRPSAPPVRQERVVPRMETHSAPVSRPPDVQRSAPPQAAPAQPRPSAAPRESRPEKPSRNIDANPRKGGPQAGLRPSSSYGYPRPSEGQVGEYRPASLSYASPAQSYASPGRSYSSPERSYAPSARSYSSPGYSSAERSYSAPRYRSSDAGNRVSSQRQAQSYSPRMSAPSYSGARASSGSYSGSRGGGGGGQRSSGVSRSGGERGGGRSHR